MGVVKLALTRDCYCKHTLGMEFIKEHWDKIFFTILIAFVCLFCVGIEAIIVFILSPLNEPTPIGTFMKGLPGVETYIGGLFYLFLWWLFNFIPFFFVFWFFYIKRFLKGRIKKIKVLKSG